MRIGIAGIAGRMGRMVATQAALAGAELSGGVALAGEAPADGLEIFENIAALARASDVVVDFTHASAASAHAVALAAARIPWVLGTTGISEADQHAVRAASANIAVVQAANFSPA